MGKIVVIGMFVLAGLMTGLVYFTFQRSGQLHSEISDKVQIQFQAYAKEVQASSSMGVEKWKLDLQDKKVVVLIPRPAIATQEELDQQQALAFVNSFLQKQFPNEKTFDVSVKFQ